MIARAMERRATFRDDSDRESLLRRLALIAQEEALRAVALSTEEGPLYDDALAVVRVLVQI